MAAPNIQMDPTQYTTAANSVFGRVAATLQEYGRSEIGVEFVRQKLEDYFGRLAGLIELRRDNRWLADHTDIEDGPSSFTWDIGEYSAGLLADVQNGWSTVNEPVVVNANFIVSVKELMRYSVGGPDSDIYFKRQIAEKYAKAMRDIVNGIIARFLSEVLNKADTTTANSYLFADGQPLLSLTHSYANGTTFSNLVQVGGVNTPLNEAALDELRKMEANMKDSSGQVPLDYSYDTLIVAAGSANEKAAFQLVGLTNAMAVAQASVAINGATPNQALFPQQHGQINVYHGSMKVVSVKGMDPTLWLAVDSTKAAPIELRIVQEPRQYDEVVRENGVRTYTYFGAVEFWAKSLPKYVAGSRG